MSPSESREPVTRERRRNAWLVAYRAASDVAAKGAFFVVSVLAARRLGQEGFGIFSLGTTVGWIAAVASDFGMQLHAARAIAQRPHESARILAAWGRVRLATAVVALLVLIAGVVVVPVAPRAGVAIALLASVYIISGLLEFLFHICRGLGRTDIESTLTLAQRGATLVLAAAALWWWPDVRVLAAAMLVPVAATLAYAIPLIAGLAGRAARGAGAPPAAPRRRPDASGVFAIGAAIVLSALYFRIDVFVIEIWQGTAAVALYSAVFRLVDALRLLPAAVLAVALPAMFTAPSHRLPLRLAAWLTGGGVLITAGVAAGAAELIGVLYGPEFAAAVPAFRVLMLAFPLMCLNYVLTQQLVGWHRHGFWAASCGAALLFNIILNAELVPRIGILGAAWATVWTEAFMTVICGAGLAVTSAPAADVRAVQSAVL